MTLDFEEHAYELFQNWKENNVKDSFTTELKKEQKKKKSLFLSYYQMAI